MLQRWSFAWVSYLFYLFNSVYELSLTKDEDWISRSELWDGYGRRIVLREEGEEN